MTLEIPPEIYEYLVKAAIEIGKTPEELAVQWLSTSVSQDINDPIEKFIGIINSNIPDWTEQHDKYLRQSLTDSEEL